MKNQMMLARKYSVYIPILILFLSGNSFADEMDDFMESPKALYRFGDHLSEARAWTLERNKKSREGVWKEDQFVFEEGSPEEAIKMVSKEQEGEKGEKGILFNSVPKMMRRLQFKNIPAGSKLVLYYFYPLDKSTPKGVSLDMRIWTGKHLLKTIHFSPEIGWKSMSVDLGVINFLNRNISVTFDVYMDKNEKVDKTQKADLNLKHPEFIFDAEII